ncbi:MAG: hypothetical protein AMXMBFR33_28570 [Candidatus Xenobia bacterium]
MTLSTDFSDPESRPYFLWSEDLNVGDLRAILAGERGAYLQEVYLGRLLREARVHEVWQFVTPEDVVTHWDRLSRHLGRARSFWEYLLSVWEKHGLVRR